jgi:hypothetical protein
MILRILLACAILSVVLVNVLLAQETDFDRWKRAQQRELNQFNTSQDEAFSTFLRQSWISVSLLKESAPGNNKPDLIPQFVLPAEASEVKVISQLNEQSVTNLTEPFSTQPQPAALIDPSILVFPSGNETLAPFTVVQTIGFTLQIPYLSYYAQPLSGTLNNETIANHWDYLVAGPYLPFVNHVEMLRSTLHWNDWSTAMNIRAIATTWTSDENSIVALSWFLLSKLGYRVQVGYQINELYLIIASDQPIYHVPKLTFSGDPFAYYLVHGLNARLPEESRIYTYTLSKTSETQPLALRFSRNPRTSGSTVTKEVTFVLGETKHSVELSYDKDVVDFYATYPETHPSLNFILPPSASFVRGAKEQIQPLIEGQSEEEALNILIRLVQTGFDYKTDREQFGRQRFMTPDEILFYPYSDCDDRAILFSWLVRLLLDVEVVGLEYPGHIATAVKLKNPPPGDKVMINGEIWLICDPTYIMANIGHVIPEYASITPTVIRIE